MLTLSEPASRKLQEILAQQEKPIYGLRVHAMAGCCSGPSYGMSLATESAPGDWEATIDGVRLVVDAESAALLEVVLERMSATLEAGESVKISAFGSFVVRQKGKRVGRNPKTGVEVPILPRKVLVFRPSHVLKDRVNVTPPSPEGAGSGPAPAPSAPPSGGSAG